MSKDLIFESAGAAAANDLSESQAREVIDQARLAMARTLDGMADFDALATLAFDGRAWVPLGYGSWDELCAAEFTQARIRTSVEERGEKAMRLTQAGMSTRAIGALLGVSYKTIQRDLATGTNVPVARPVTSGDGAVDSAVTASTPVSTSEGQLTRDTSRPKSQGLDGRERGRSTPVERVERGLRVAQLKEAGHTQAQIGEALGVSQRTISSDERMVGGWSDRLSREDQDRLSAGELSVEEVAAKAAFTVVPAKGPDLAEMMRHTTRDLLALLEVIDRDIIHADAFLDQRDAVAEPLVMGLVTTIAKPAKWLRQVEFGAFSSVDLENLAAVLEQVEYLVRESIAEIDNVRGLRDEAQG